ncbi:MAG TPA: class I SAM-dependent methyltransferase [Terracidiphilus sp.]|nr:class I SAM-dependent methyltransferase [Terracidiphilus sp.]
MNALSDASRKAADLGRSVISAGRLLYRDGPAGLFNKVTHWLQYRASQPKIDAEYGTETLAWVSLADLSASGPNVSYATEYGPSPAFDFDRILRRLPVPYSEHVFVDLGCGKGLVLMLASQFGFSRIIGVEFARNLYEIALTNLDKFRQRNAPAQPIEVMLGDAADFPFPTEPLVVYLYHPFGPEVIGKVLANLRTSLSEHPRSCWVVYVNPVHHQVIARCGFLVTHKAVVSREYGEPYALYTYQQMPETRATCPIG